MAQHWRSKNPTNTADAAKDLEAGRLLVRWTCGEMAQACGVHVSAVWDLARGKVSERQAVAFRQRLELEGIIFGKPGLVRHVDGRLAPTYQAVGIMRGKRLARARRAMGMGFVDLALEAGVGPATIRKLEAGYDLRVTASVYAVVGALQLAGYQFARNRRDRRVGERRRPLRPWEKDIPLDYLGVGLGIGLRGLELKDEL